ncbi:MAG: type 2 lantipeptide synthetase LanM, partial [Algicola sp.]|nr:type 2 lantipeptide synthetase LanM [Algicola sp.]
MKPLVKPVKQSSDFVYYQCSGFELLTEASLLNVFTLSEKQALAVDLNLYDSQTQVSPTAIQTTLSQSPFNDAQLLELWYQHHQLDQRKLALLHGNAWVRQSRVFKAAISGHGVDENSPELSPLLTQDRLGKLVLFKHQINAVLVDAQSLSDTTLLAFLPALLNRLEAISYQAIAFVEQKYSADSQNEIALRYRVFNHFPVLLRQVVQACSDWLNYLREFTTHLNNDLEELQIAFAGDKPLGSLQAIESEQGDRHNKGRFALVCRFASGIKLVYKPRSLALDQQFYRFLAFVTAEQDQPTFYQPDFVLREQYGWMEYIDALPCEEQTQVAEYFYHSGYLLSVLYLLEAEDIHHENVIARGNTPVIIDLETLFHLRDDSVCFEQSVTVHHSVLKTHFIGQYDLATPEQDEAAMITVSGPAVAQSSIAESSAEFNRSGLPTFAGFSQPLNDYGDDFVKGFKSGYQQLLKLKTDLLPQLNRFKGLTSRYIARPSQIYHRLWQSSCQPYYQQSGLALEMGYEKLWMDVKNRPFLSNLIDAEKAALLQGDIPLFNCVIGENSVAIDGKVLCHDYFKQDGFALVVDKLAGLSNIDCAAQLKIIERSMGLNHKKISLIGQKLQVFPGGKNDSWLQSSELIASQILSQTAIAEHSVLWPVYKRGKEGLFCLDGTNYQLHDGVSGILFYLAYLHEVSAKSVDCMLLKRSTGE